MSFSNNFYYFYQYFILIDKKSFKKFGLKKKLIFKSYYFLIKFIVLTRKIKVYEKYIHFIL